MCHGLTIVKIVGGTKVWMNGCLKSAKEGRLRRKGGYRMQGSFRQMVGRSVDLQMGGLILL